MTKKMFVLLFILSLTCRAQNEKELTKYVNPMIGTGGHGHTYPAATMPFGMVQLGPDTGIDGWDWCSGYHYSDNSIMGFSHTHLSGTGLADYGDILFMPFTGEIKMNSGSKENPDEGYRSRFSHKNEITEPGYYSVILDDYKIKAELTVTNRVGFHQYTFPENVSGNFLIDLKHGIQDNVVESGIQLVDNDRILGYRKSKGTAEHAVYFAASLSVPFRNFAIASDDSIHRGVLKLQGKNIKAFFNFPGLKKNSISIKIGISHTSMAGAIKNLEAEISDFNFARVRAEASKEWNKRLNKIIVEGGTEDQKTVFYTALYHSLICPNLFNDINNMYIGMDNQLHTKTSQNMYTVFSLWDTFRATHPLFTIIEPKLAVEFVNSLLQKYNESGMLPIWELASNETYVMIGYHSISVITDAIMKDMSGIDVEKAYKAMKHSAELDIRGLEYYKSLGYIPSDMDSESVSKLLEYCYDDWCIAQVANKLGKVDDYEYFINRSKNYLNVFDKETGFMRAIENGDWKSDFDPNAVSSVYTEANAWHYTFFVPQDVNGLIELYGGNANFINKLDDMFSADSKLGGYHQPDVSGLIGQYAHGNEPSHHSTYLYNYAGAAGKAQSRVREIMDTMYSNTPDGLSGNEDCGQMSSWFVFSAMGFYPVCPGDNQYIIGSPLFDRVTINLENGKKFIVNAQNNSEKKVFIDSATLNGEAYYRSFITHDDITNGGNLTFQMSNEANNSFGSENPVSEILFEKIPIPLIKSPGDFFDDSQLLEIISRDEDADIYYTLDGSNPTFESNRYDKAFTIDRTTEINAIAIMGDVSSSSTYSKLYKYNNEYEVTLNSSYSPRYSGGGPKALINDVLGTKNHKSLPWQGYEEVDLDAQIDLGSVKTINSLYGRFLQDQRVWIFHPSTVEFLISVDGKNWKQVIYEVTESTEKNDNVIISEIGSELNGIDARYIHLKAKNVGHNPDWHHGAGGKSWVFIDEIKISVDE